ncbi:hypothetical protein EG329_000345 [Mollisiaceae sp. DMI_Dod_QoI]|nr:hypothetical protein EG329_000345 [Helotiales sp. DMI_Dod_QoI]
MPSRDTLADRPEGHLRQSSSSGKSPVTEKDVIQEPNEPALKSLQFGLYTISPLLQSISKIIDTMKVGHERYFPRCGEIAVGTIDITELNDPEPDCVICYMPLTNYKAKTKWWEEHCAVVSSCGHIFGGKCIFRWVKEGPNRRSCPMCRKMFRGKQRQSLIMISNPWEIHWQYMMRTWKIVATHICRTLKGLNTSPTKNLVEDFTEEYFAILRKSPVLALHHFLWLNIGLQGATETLSDNEEFVLLLIKHAQRIIKEMWSWGDSRGFMRPKDLDFALQDPPNPTHHAVYLNVVHDLIAETEGKVGHLVQSDIVKLKLANFNGAEIKSGKICIKRPVYPMYYYINYEREIPGFHREFSKRFGAEDLDSLERDAGLESGMEALR